MAKAKILTKCFKCAGAGVWDTVTDSGPQTFDPCPVCGGDKWLDTNTRLDLTNFEVLNEKLDTIIGLLSE